jgi:hypothetical protein
MLGALGDQTKAVPDYEYPRRYRDALAGVEQDATFAPLTNSYVAAARHFALGDTAIYGLLRLRMSTLIAQDPGLGVNEDVWFADETGSL